MTSSPHLIAIQKTTQATQALNFVGSKVVVDGTTVALTRASRPGA